MVRISLICLTLLAAAGFAPASAEDLKAIFADYWANDLEEYPFGATQSGVNDYDDRAPDASPAAQKRRLDEAAAFLKRLDGADKTLASESDLLSADLLRFILKHRIALGAFDEWRIPFLADGGFHTDMGYAVAATPFRNAADYEKYLKRLHGLPAYLDQNIENMRAGIAAGFTQPREILDGALSSFDGQVTEPRAHPLYAPFAAMPASIPKKVRANFLREADKVMSNEVAPAFARVAKFMHEEYAAKARATLGAAALPNGPAYYEALVKYYTTRDDATAAAIHALGLKEVARIRRDMAAVMKETGFSGSFAEFLEFLRTDQQFYAKSPEELLRYAASISKDIDGRLPGYFGKLPRQPYSVEPVPAEIAENYTTGRYSPSPPGSDRGGQYWVNTTHLDKRPLFEITALTLHEAVPGHHLQGALAYEIEDAPEFRKQFYPHAFGEGWGLYAEKLGVEMGVYKTPYDTFGRLSYEMWRACRLVIDTGLHSKDWTRQQAMDYLASNTALSMKNVQTEVDRYIAWPGQALAYKIGELTIWELRAKAEKALGPKFDIRTFHDAVLDDGGLPLDILAKRIDAYIAHEKARG
ncbi:MAG: DUF885 family protein [Parvularculaceae bacterium]